MKNKFVFVLIQVIFTLVGVGMLIAGYLAAPDSLTDDGFPLNKFFYMMGAFFIVWPILLFGVINFFMKRAAQNIEQLKAHGLKGSTRILSMDQTGVRINHVPQVKMQLDIKTDMGERYQTSYKKCLPQMYYSLIKPDAVFTVYIDPKNRNKLYVDFDEAWAKAVNSNSNW
jgi:hypothetical protein